MHLPAKGLRLKLFAFADRINAKLSQNEWLVNCEVMQVRDIATKRWLPMEVDIKRDEVHLLKIEILCRWKVGIAHESVRIGRLHRIHEFSEERTYFFRSMPARHIRRNLVADKTG